MKQNFLDFEQPLAELHAKIEELRLIHDESGVDVADEIGRLEKKNQQLTKDIKVEKILFHARNRGDSRLRIILDAP